MNIKQNKNRKYVFGYSYKSKVEGATLVSYGIWLADSSRGYVILVT